MAVSFLNRLNALLYFANDASMRLNASEWYFALNSLYRELYADMQPEETKEADAYVKNLNRLVNIWNAVVQRRGSTGLTPELYGGLHDYEILLRKVIKKAGYQGKTSGDPGAALR